MRHLNIMLHNTIHDALLKHMKQLGQRGGQRGGGQACILEEIVGSGLYTCIIVYDG